MNAVERAQNAFEDEFNDSERRHKGVGAQAARRKIFAYGAKLLVAIAGLLMTLEALKPYNVPVGIMIAVVAMLDFVFSNHVKLIVMTRAEQAYRRLLKEVRNEHTLKMPELLAVKDADESRFAALLLPLLQELTRKLQTERAKIEKAIDEADLKALNRLAIDTT